MDNFNNEFGKFNNSEDSAELNGFDYASAEPKETPVDSVTEGFYTTPKENIIQDEPTVKTEAEPIKSVFEEQSGPVNQGFHNTNAYYSGYENRTPYGFKAPKPKREKKKYGGGVVALACVLAIIVGAISGGAVSYLATKDGSNSPIITNIPNNKVNINVKETAETIVEAVAQKVTPCVVGIRTTTSVMNFFGGTSEASGDGSGVIYSPEGYIITNYHVIADASTSRAASKIEVYLDSESSKSYDATLVGYNISADLAVIKINAKGLPAIETADSDSLKVGQYVITVGNPGGLEFMDSVTYGVVSGLNRVVSASSGIELIQTDAAINPGNSGGALVNSKGELVGINSSKIVSEEFEGMGFAIPSNTVVEICDNIIEKENAPEPYVGISVSEKYTAQVLKYYGYPTGAVVLSVADGSPADEAGIERGDIITEFNGVEIAEYTMLEDAVKTSSPGEKVNVKLYRSGKYYTATLTVSSNNSIN